MNNVIKISGLDCANCALELEEEIGKLEGVTSVSVDFMAQKVIVDCEEGALEKVKYCCNHFEEVRVVEESEGAATGEKIKICGLHCANCGRDLEEDLNKEEGVEARVDFAGSQIFFKPMTTEARARAGKVIKAFGGLKIVDKPVQKRGNVRSHLKEIICIAVALVFFVPALALNFTLGKTNAAAMHAAYALYSVAYLSVGWQVLLNTAKNIAKGKIFDENFLMTVASLGAILLGIFTDEGFFEGVAVMFLYAVGELLQGIAVGASRNSISDLLDMKSESATKFDGANWVVVRPEELKIGDKIMIKAGEKVPVDCKILSGESSIDTKSLTGEPVPRDIKAGGEALSGSINLSGVLEAEVLREYKNSAVAKILELVENSTAKKTKSEKFISKFARYYTPAVCAAALVVAAIVPTVICAVGGAFLRETYESWIYKALNFLVISCPCALVISVPLSYFGGIGRCAKSGILVKGSTCLDEIAACKVAAFDKTGTITEGRFGIVFSSSERALKLAAAVEKMSAHPIAAAFEGVETDVAVTNVCEVAGKGVTAVCEGKILLCGNAALLADAGVKFDAPTSLSTLVFVALSGEYVGYIAIDDKIKSGAQEAISALKAGGIEYAEMLTGDLNGRAEKIASEVGLDGFKAELLPDEKLKRAEELKARGKLLYVGDGINDAPVMTCADCAVSMGKVGSDAAIEASDIVLVSDNLALLPKAKKIAKKTRRRVTENIIGSLLVKAAIMVCSVAIPSFPLIISIIADVGVMLVAVLNAMRIEIAKV